jgi:hypothetical protein
LLDFPKGEKMNRGEKRWVTIEVPTSKGIIKFKKKIAPFAKLIGILMEEWDFHDVEKIKISHKSNRQVSVQRLRELERENERLKKDHSKQLLEIKNLYNEAKSICTNLEKVSDRFSAQIAENKNGFYNKWGKLKFPESFRTLLKMNTGNGHGPHCRLVWDSETKQNYIDIGRTRMTIANWRDFLNFASKVNKKFRLARGIKNPFETN